jgi:hypothetical protein
MDNINLEELSGYQEDEKGLRDFQRPYLIPSLLGMAIALTGFVLMISEMEASHHYRGQELTFLDKVWFHFEKVMQEAGVAPGVHGYLPAAFFAGGLILLSATMLVMARATPVSSISKNKMEKYWNANPDPGVTEIIYVDRSSRTYFRRVFATRGRGPNTPPIPM